LPLHRHYLTKLPSIEEDCLPLETIFHCEPPFAEVNPALDEHHLFPCLTPEEIEMEIEKEVEVVEKLSDELDENPSENLDEKLAPPLLEACPQHTSKKLSLCDIVLKARNELFRQKLQEMRDQQQSVVIEKSVEIGRFTNFLNDFNINQNDNFIKNKNFEKLSLINQYKDIKEVNEINIISNNLYH
jgi:hypothetical protein